MKVHELILLLQQCDSDVTVNFVNEEGYFTDIEFVENRLQSPNGWDPVVSLREDKPNWKEFENCKVEEISADYVFATTKYHDFSPVQ